jgi:hypothetical protein
MVGKPTPFFFVEKMREKIGEGSRGKKKKERIPFIFDEPKN